MVEVLIWGKAGLVGKLVAHSDVEPYRLSLQATLGRSHL